MINIPLQATPSQTVKVTLGGQYCVINLYQNSTGMYLDLTVNGTAIISSAICLNLVRIVRYSYLGFIGNLVFIDNQGKADPTFDLLNSRYQLMYLSANE
jgi:hypothetical protein